MLYVRCSRCSFTTLTAARPSEQDDCLNCGAVLPGRDRSQSSLQGAVASASAAAGIELRLQRRWLEPSPRRRWTPDRSAPSRGA